MEGLLEIKELPGLKGYSNETPLAAVRHVHPTGFDLWFPDMVPDQPAKAKATSDTKSYGKKDAGSH